MIAIIGNQWVSSQAGGVRRLDDARDLVRIEIAAALARGIPVVPVLVGGAVMPTGEELRRTRFRRSLTETASPYGQIRTFTRISTG